MFVKYGSYSHDAGEVELSVSKDALYTQGGTRWAHRWRWELRGQLVSSSEAAMDVLVAALEAAYAVNGQDLSLQFTGGGATELGVTNSATVGGVRVVSGPTYPDNRNAAYVTYLPYTIVLEADVGIASGSLDTGLVSFEETVTKEGGGPRFGMLEPVVGLPVRQTLKRNTIYRVRQFGRAVGVYARPTPPVPLWPNALMQAPAIEYGHPKRFGGGTSTSYTEYPVSWEYRFESARPLFGNGNIWGVTYGN